MSRFKVVVTDYEYATLKYEEKVLAQILPNWCLPSAEPRRN